MCRHLATVDAVPFATAPLLFDEPHALAKQARCPRLQLRGDTNPDGWGLAWYSDPSAAPSSYRTVTPIWDDRAFAASLETSTCTALIAAARLASPGAAITEAGNAPFVSGRWSFSLNGIVDGFADGVGDALRAQLEPARRAAIVSDADTEVLFALLLQCLAAGAAPADALADVVHTVTGLTTGRLNLLLTDGQALYGTRYGNSLFRRGRVLASEPLDDRPDWQEIPDQTLVSITPDDSSASSL